MLGRRPPEDHGHLGPRRAPSYSRWSAPGRRGRSKGSGRAGRSRRGRRRPRRGWPAPSRPPAPGSARRLGAAGRPPAGAARRRFVRPTTTRSVATSRPPAANASFSGRCRGPSSTIPGVTTTRRPSTGGRGQQGERGLAPAGFELNVSSTTSTPDGAWADVSRFGTAATRGEPLGQLSAATPSPRATATAQARLVGCTPPATAPSAATSRPATATATVPSASGDADVGRLGRRAEHRTTSRPLPSPASRSASSARRAVVDVQDDGRRPLGDLGLRLDDRVLGAEPLEVHGADRGDDRDVRRAPAAQVGDLAGPVGAHLGDEDLGAVDEVLVDGPGEPGAVVEDAGRGHDRPGARRAAGRGGAWSRSCRRSR